VQFGTIIAIHHGDYLDMVYQMLTTTNELKSGKAIAKISINDNEKHN
jgi:adenine specific DNA methylase Mod